MPAPPAATAEHTGDATLDRIQAHLRALIAYVKLIPFIPGRPVMVHFASPGGKLVVNHKLGVPAACFVIRMNTDSAMNGPTFAEWNDQSGLDEKNQIALVANSVCTVVLWFYPRIPLSIPNGATQS